MDQRNRPIVVLSTGRAGSTLLQKLLNTHQELLIWGEHGGILNSFMNAARVVSRLEWIPEEKPRGSWLLEKDRPLEVDRWTAWDGSFSKSGFQQHLKAFIDGLFCEEVPRNIRWGFKEIRYRTIELMDFWSSLYPESQYILLVRNPVDSCVSFTLSITPDNATVDEIQENVDRMVSTQVKPVILFFRGVLKKYSDNVYPVLFQNLVREPHETLEDIRKYLGLASEFDRESVVRMMSKDIVSQRKRSNRSMQDLIRNMTTPLLHDEQKWFNSFSKNPAMR